MKNETNGNMVADAARMADVAGVNRSVAKKTVQENGFMSRLAVAMLASTGFGMQSVLAAEYVVNIPTTVTNGDVAHVLDGGDSLTITGTGVIDMTGTAGSAVNTSGNNNNIGNSGLLVTDGIGAFGIFVYSDNIINNSGTITTLGNTSEAIDADNNNTITNTGAITVSGLQSEGINANDNNMIVNNGTITSTAIGAAGFGSEAIFVNDGNMIANTGIIITAGDNAEGINVDDNNTITNTGTIKTSGEEAQGIFAENNNPNITNAGTITTAGYKAQGISVINNNTVINTGTIKTAGERAQGIFTDSFNPNITNTGTIVTTGALSQGITGRGGNVINNSGYVVSAQSNSIISGASTLNLSAPAFLGGAIDLIGASTLNITTGRSQSNLWQFDPADLAGPPTIGGEVPWAYNAATGTFATLDPTALGAAPDMLADSIALLSQTTRSNNGVDDGNWWLSGFGGVAGYGAVGINNEYTNASGGVAGGISFDVNDSFNIGLMAAYLASNLNVNSAWVTSQTINSNGMAGGIYGNAKMDNMFADFAIYAGVQSNKSSRFVNDNLATNSAGQTMGIGYADANYNSWFLSPEIRLGMDIETDGEWTVTPSASARFSTQQIDGYTETGSNANATIGVRSVQVFEGNLELAASRDMGNGMITAKAGVQYRQNPGAATRGVTLLGQSLAIPVNTGGAVAGYVGLDASYDLGANSILNLAGKTLVGGSGYASLSASLGIKTMF